MRNDQIAHSQKQNLDLVTFWMELNPQTILTTSTFTLIFQLEKNLRQIVKNVSTQINLVQTPDKERLGAISFTEVYENSKVKSFKSNRP